MSDLAQNFRFHRQNGKTASLALECARADVRSAVVRYPTCGDIGAATERGARFVEHPAANGLRFVGYADKLVRLEHTGWFTDADGLSKIRGVVYQLPARKGRPVYISGHDDENNGDADCGGPALIDFSRLFYGEPGGYQFDAENDQAARETARAADSFAEREAEEECEYQTAWQAGSLYQQKLDEYRGSLKTMIAGLKHARTAPKDVRIKWAQTACDMRRECFAELDRLIKGNFSGLEFYPSNKLTVAFYEGRGI